MMLRIALAAIMVASITGVVALTGIAPTSAQSAPSATRNFDLTSVAPEGQVVVTIEATDYGLAGGVTETLPPGFSYVTSSLSPGQVVPGQVNESGQNVRFTLQGETSFTYTVTASSTPGPYDFSGMLRDIERDDYLVGGATEVTVLDTSMPAATPTADTSMPAATPTADTSMPAATPTRGHVDAGGHADRQPRRCRRPRRRRRPRPRLCPWPHSRRTQAVAWPSVHLPGSPPSSHSWFSAGCWALWVPRAGG